MQVPAVSPQQAGNVASHGDMNNYSAAASFLCNPPSVQAFAAGQTGIPAAPAFTAVQWFAPARDNDSTWSAAAPDRFTIGTTGFYQVTARVVLSSSCFAAECFLRVTTGAANPAGSGAQSSFWHGSGFSAGSPVSAGSSGILPALLYPGDFIQLIISPAVACSTDAIAGYAGDWWHRLVSL